MKIGLPALGSVLLLSGMTAHADLCFHANGPDIINYDLSESFTEANNHKGATVTLTKSNNIQVMAICPEATQNFTWRSYVTSYPVVKVEDGFKYLKLNDYLLGAMQITDSSAGIFYPPVDNKKMGSDEWVSKHAPFNVNDSNLTFRLRVIKPFINYVPIPQRRLFDVHVTTTDGAYSPQIVYSISFSGVIQVPQSCVINQGTVVTFDFNNASSGAFASAGVGERPNGVNPQSKTIAIKCSNVEQYATLTMRLQSSRASGDMMVSDNPDVGFKVADANRRIFVPNDVSSLFPFKLNGDAASTTIEAWPVSVTGHKPAEGLASAEGYLRIDYQ